MAYETILTNVGLQKIASATPEHQLKINRIAVGDGNGGYSPLDPDMTELVNEVWRGPASAPIRDRNDATIIIFEGQIPANIGGFFIREVGIFDDTGDLIAIGQTAATEKPQDTSGTALTLTVRFRVKLSNASETELIYNDEAPIDHQGTNNRDAPDAHPISSITGLDNALNGKADKSTFVFAGTGLKGGGALSSNVTLSADFGTGAGKVTEGNDERLSNAREWTAETVSQAEAEAGTSTIRRAWTAQRVRQAITAWWAGVFGTGADQVRSNAQNDARFRLQSASVPWEEVSGKPSIVSQAEAEAGTSTTVRQWTAQRVRQAIVAGYNALTSAFGRTLANASDATAARNTLGLGTAATRGVTTSSTDTTSGRVLKVGDFGVGNTIGIPAGANLNNYTTPGEYRQDANANASPELNYPAQLAGSLKVIQAAGGVVQEYTTYGNTRRKFLRGFYNDVWSSWVEFYHSGNVDDLISGLNLVPASRTISTGTGLTGGGNLSANRTISLASSHIPIGVGQTWQNMTSSRAAGTTYTNTTGRPIVVNVSFHRTGGSNAAAHTFLVNGVTVGRSVTRFSQNEKVSFTSAVVPSGATYRVDSVENSLLLVWAELR